MARLTAALEWRLRLRVDDLPSLRGPALERYRRLRVRPFVGFDRTGRPVQFERVGEFLGSGNWRAYPFDDWVRHFTVEYRLPLNTSSMQTTLG